MPARRSTGVPAMHRLQRPGLLGEASALRRILTHYFRPEADPITSKAAIARCVYREVSMF